MNHNTGIEWFLTGTATVNVYFPEGEVKCQYCPFCRPESDMKRYWCRLTNSMIYEPFVKGLPDFCPVKITGEIKGTKKEGE